MWLPLFQKTLPNLDLIGGKARGLMQLAGAGFEAPSGAVLTTEFFAPWRALLEHSVVWTDFLNAPETDWTEACARVKKWAEVMEWTEAQLTALEALRAYLMGESASELFAVRSSAPEEDLAGASFAGGYETVLGVSLDGLESAVRRCFLSSLDERVFRYKRARGIPLGALRFAVVVQQQIDSESAGVAFSLNPLTNDFDEAVVDANWGLGETVVAGLATPDHFVVDKVQERIVERSLGAKQAVHRLNPSGGWRLEEAVLEHPLEACLPDTKILALVETVKRIEALLGFPVDVEWAWADETLYILQARPITSYVPLSPELQTLPGERRRLYMDIALSSGLTINAPISTLGVDWMERVLRVMFRPFLGAFELTLEPQDRYWFFAGHRMYQDLSNMLWLSSPQRMARGMAESDALMAETLRHLHGADYRAEQRPRWIGWNGIKRLPRLLWGVGGLLRGTLRAVVFPEKTKARHLREVEAFRRRVDDELQLDLPLDLFIERATAILAQDLARQVVPSLSAYLLAHSLVDLVVGKRDPERLERAQKLKLGFAGNVVAEMGIALHSLASQIGSVDSSRCLPERFEAGELPDAFYRQWEDFGLRFGCRGPAEMDLGSPRFGDAPALVLGMVEQLAKAATGDNPKERQAIAVAQRREAFRTVSDSLGPVRRRLLARLNRLLESFGDTRDTPKHQSLCVYHAVRRRVMREGEQLVAAGLLDKADAVFELTFEDLEAVKGDPALDLRSIRKKRGAFRRKLEQTVSTFPGIIDSRGRILRPPPPPETPGLLRGTPISAGVAKGVVKVLRHPGEKQVEAGDVLVAYTTDPGWTPLFVPAAAILLEVGGTLQHGAVVAREYGKPCVAGIDRITTRLKDGDVVEVDGARGTVRLFPS